MKRQVGQGLRRDHGERGVSLIELMTVFTIILLVSLLAVVSFGRELDVNDVASALAMKLREASRKAVAKGPVREDVLEVDDTVTPTRVRIHWDSDTDLQHVMVERVEEDAFSDGVWTNVELMRFTVPEHIAIAGQLPSVEVDQGQTLGSITALAPDHYIGCRANGSCDPITLYIQTTGPQSAYVRVVMMPLNGAPIVLQGW